MTTFRRELKTRARTRTRNDAKTYEHQVSLELTSEKRWVLRIEGTGASWYMSTLLGSDARRPTIPGARIAIDFGQGWYCENFDEVFAEAASRI